MDMVIISEYNIFLAILMDIVIETTYRRIGVRVDTKTIVSRASGFELSILRIGYTHFCIFPMLYLSSQSSCCSS
jgi:hypothetical protein